MLEQLIEEIQKFKEVRALDEEPLYSVTSNRSYPDKDGCVLFESAIEARIFIEKLLGEAENGYVVINHESGEIYASPLPIPSLRSKLVPEWLDVRSSGFIRIGSQYWEWTDDYATVWLCPVKLF